MGREKGRERRREKGGVTAGNGKEKRGKEKKGG